MSAKSPGARAALPAQFWMIWSGQVVTLAGNSVLRFAFVVRAGAASGLVVVAGLSAVYFLGELQLWQVYAAVALMGAAAAFQFPALSSAVPLLVPKGKYQRANGLLFAASSIAAVCGPGPLADHVFEPPVRDIDLLIPDLDAGAASEREAAGASAQ